jgi:hypothetical protein
VFVRRQGPTPTVQEQQGHAGAISEWQGRWWCFPRVDFHDNFCISDSWHFCISWHT